MKAHPTCKRTAPAMRADPTVLYIPEVGPSLNKFFGRMHRRTRTRLVNTWKTLVMAELRQQEFTRPNAVDFPLRAVVRAHFKNRAHWYDSGNVGATEKLVVDGLRAEDVLPDDDPRYIFGTGLESWLHNGATGEDRFTLFLFRPV